MKSKSVILIALLLIGIFLIAYSLISRLGMKEKSVFVGLYTPEFELVNAADGKRILSSDLKGKVLFINFWASWCSPCREEMPSIDKLSKHFSTNQDFIMLPILSIDSPQDAVNYLKENRFNLPILIDREGKAARVYGLTGVPETFIVDKKGILRKKIIGPYEWDSPDVLTLISSLLKE